MIYTVTLNPSLDYVVDVKNFAMGATNRTCKEAIYPGGKGLNVSMVLGNLGISSVAIGFVAGFVGEEISRLIGEYGVHTDFIKLKEGTSRINVKLPREAGTEINGMGPEVPEEAMMALMKKLDDMEHGDILVLAGSIPASMPANTYEKMLERIAKRNILTVVDASGDLLWRSLKYHPFLLKPNQHEMGELFGVEIDSKETAAVYGRKLQEEGARNVLISMGAEGGVFVPENGPVIASPASDGVVVNPVGAGDASVAGFIAGFLAEQSFTKSFALAMAAGGASACQEYMATKEQIMEALNSIHVDRIPLDE